MSTVTSQLGYVGQQQVLTWLESPATVQSLLWGAGGGGGGGYSSSGNGGNGGGGSFVPYAFTINPGDTISVAVGQGGTGGAGSLSGTAGLGGRSLVYQVFDLALQSNVVRVTDPAWNYFMQAHAAWDAGGPSASPIFRTYTVNFPVTGYYVFQFSADSAMTVTFDGNEIINYSGFSSDPAPFYSRFITAGNHTLNVSATTGGARAGVALTVDASFSGANGGINVGGGGGGGGGGGATVLLINNIVVAVAGGGGGGGGAGQNRNTISADANGPWGWPSLSNDVTLPQDGQESLLGGSGGGAGGGQSGGNGGHLGGATPTNPAARSNSDATAGSYGESIGGGYALPSGRTPGGTTEPRYSGSSVGGYGGNQWPLSNGQNGLNGSAVLQFDISGSYVRDAGLWKTIRDTYIRNNDQWQRVQNMYVNNQGSWELVYGTTPPVFSAASGSFGQFSRRRASI